MSSPRVKSKTSNSISPASPSVSQDNSEHSSPTNDPRFSMLSTLELKHIDETDPSLTDGHKIIFDKEIPVAVRADGQSEQTQDLGAVEVLRVKVLTKVCFSLYCFKIWLNFRC